MLTLDLTGKILFRSDNETLRSMRSVRTYTHTLQLSPKAQIEFEILEAEALATQ